jgi:GNAT superfamily N-acetyltransferase
MSEHAALLSAYDEQLRTEAETPGAVHTTRLGPLRLATYPGGRGFISYRSLEGTDVRDLVGQVVEHCRADPDITSIEWKTRGHDRAPGLVTALAARGFSPGEPEAIMIGQARSLVVDVDLPPGVSLRRIHEPADLLAMSAMLDEVFGDTTAIDSVAVIQRRLDNEDGIELWVAQYEGQMIGAGRLEPVRGTRFAGIWGGAMRPEWRGRGIYRALTAARARSALRMGKSLIHSDSSEYSRPILERSGLIKVSTTTAYSLRLAPSTG